MDNYIIIGTSRSGKSLVAGIINCVPEITIHQKDLSQPFSQKGIYLTNLNYPHYSRNGLNILNQLNDLDLPKIIWVVRSPIQSVCSYMQNLNLSAENAFQYWFDVNTILWYYYTSLWDSNRFLVKYEDVIMSRSCMSSTFSFMGLKYNEQYKNYGDFDQPDLHCPIFNRGRINKERVIPYRASDFCLEDQRRVYRNKPLLGFLGYNLNVLD